MPVCDAIVKFIFISKFSPTFFKRDMRIDRHNAPPVFFIFFKIRFFFTLPFFYGAENSKVSVCTPK